MIKNICVFCSSSDAINKRYFDEASVLGAMIGQKGYHLVHGGGKIGLMGVLGKTVKAGGGKVTGIIPEKLNREGIASETDDRLIVTKDMNTRKENMRELADAFIALPGGFGTLEEILEVITLKQLKYHTKPIVFININGYYDNLFRHFNESFNENFAKPDYNKLYYIAADAPSAMRYIEEYSYTPVQDKWFFKEGDK